MRRNEARKNFERISEFLQISWEAIIKRLRMRGLLNANFEDIKFVSTSKSRLVFVLAVKHLIPFFPISPKKLILIVIGKTKSNETWIFQDFILKIFFSPFYSFKLKIKRGNGKIRVFLRDKKEEKEITF